MGTRPDPFDEHPDLRDPEWNRKAERAARREARKTRRRQVAVWGHQPRKRFRHWRVVAVVVTLAGLVAGGGYLLDHYRAEQPVGSHADQPLAGAADLERPFEGTPAQRWADGADGIVPPKPVALAGLSAEQVGEALRRVKDLLVAARFDPATLERGDSGRLVRMFSPSQREYLRGEFDSKMWPDYLATRLAPGYHLLPAGARVKGTMRAEATGTRGEVLVRTNYVFAYAFHVDDLSRVSAPLDLVAALRADVDFAFRPVGGHAGGLFLDDAKLYVYSMACGPARKGLLAPAYSEAAPLGLPASERPPRYFDPSRPMAKEDTCESVQPG